MSIHGIGIDVVGVERIAAILRDDRLGVRFLRRVYTAAERTYCDAHHRPADAYAARFAAKEAVLKALGTGPRGFPWQQIEVVGGRGAAPQLKLYGNCAARARAAGVVHWHLSLSHDAGIALASVTAER